MPIFVFGSDKFLYRQTRLLTNKIQIDSKQTMDESLPASLLKTSPELPIGFTRSVLFHGTKFYLTLHSTFLHSTYSVSPKQEQVNYHRSSMMDFFGAIYERGVFS